MNRDSLILKFLGNLIGDQVLSIFFMVLAFLILENLLRKRMKKVIHNKQIVIYCSAFLSSTILLFLYFIIKATEFYISKARFNIPDSYLNLPSSVFNFFAVPLVIALIYCVYHLIKDLWIKKITKINVQLIIEMLMVLIIVYTPFVLIQVISVLRGNPYSLHLLPGTMADWVPAPFGTAFAVLVYNYFQYIEKFRTQQKELQIAQLQQQLAQSQLDALSSKINPHFLYNSLNSIAGLSTEDSVKTREMAIALSKLFKYNINRDESSYASIKDEVEMAVLYLEIEKIRFEERLEYSVHVQEGIADILMPRHLLQPLVENAVKHGAGPNGVEISIIIEKNDKTLVIKVGDKGKDFDIHFNPGYGIKSLYDKLDILVPNKYEITFLNNPKEVKIEIAGLK